MMAAASTAPVQRNASDLATETGCDESSYSIVGIYSPEGRRSCNLAPLADKIQAGSFVLTR